MRARIHRGAKQVGGNCVELEAEGSRILLDLGLPLDSEDEVGVLPDIPALRSGRGLDGVLISHGHPDHWGLLGHVHPDVPVWMGEATRRIIDEADFFIGSGQAPARVQSLREGQTVQVGGFAVTPHLVDHSAFDSYGFHVQAQDRSLFYSGDLRAHGRKPGTFRRLVANPPSADVLLLEGTRLSGEDMRAGQPESEKELEERLCDWIGGTSGLALLAYSGQNLDRLVTTYRAALRSGRELVVDLYGAAIARASGRSSIPQSGIKGLRVLVPPSQRSRVIASAEFARIDAIRNARIYPEELRERAGELVVTFRGSLMGLLERADSLDGARLAWSMWRGYLEGPSGRRVGGWCDTHEIPIESLHVSGHATPRDLRRLAQAFSPARVVPIHTAAPERYEGLMERVELHRDGEWWSV